MKLPQRVIRVINVLTRDQLQRLSLRDALQAADALATKVRAGVTASNEIASLGLEILGFSILAIKPSPETARALEAQTREQLLKESDEATYARRNAAVEQERAIKENELNTEIAIENKKRQIRETQLEAERMVQEKQHQLKDAEMTASIALEQKNRELVTVTAENARREADARAYGLGVTMKALSAVDAKTIQALVSAGMQPDQLVAAAFQELAQRASQIGQLNVSPELLQTLLAARAK